MDILPVKKDDMISLRFSDEEICKMKDCEKITAPFFSGWWAVSRGWKQERLLDGSAYKKKEHRNCDALSGLTGSSLSSRSVSTRVLSAYKGLTTVFGMGTGGSP